MSEKISTAQKNMIEVLLKKLGADLQTVNYSYRQIGVADVWIGRRVPEWLDSLYRSTASDIITKLKELTE